MRPDDPRLVTARAVGARLVRTDGRSTASTEVIRDGAALVVRVGDNLVRVRPDSPANRAVADREVAVARHLEAAGVPVTPLVEPDSQPWSMDGQVVTAWAWVDAGPASTPRDLGGLAQMLRRRTSGVEPANDLPAFDPLAATVSAVAHIDSGDDEAAFVRTRAAELAERWPDAVASDPLGVSVVHGDLHPANVVNGPQGPLLTDLELAGVGGASYDAAPAVVATGRYGAPSEREQQFIDGFGADPRGWSGLDTYVSVYELWVTAWAVGVRHRDRSWAGEATRRVQTLRDGARHRWLLR